MRRFYKAISVILAAALALTAVCLPAGASDISAFSKTEAEKYSGQSEVDTGGKAPVKYILRINDGDYTCYENMDFGKGASSFTVNASAISAKGTDCGTIELHLDGKDGALIGSCGIGGTGSWSDWKDFSCDVSGASGVHDLYLVYKGSKSNSGYLFNVDYFSFSASSDSGSKDTDNTGYIGITLKKGGSAVLWVDSTDKVTYSSSDKTVAAVFSSGKVTAKKAGTAVISMKCGGKTQKLKIRVTA